MVGTRPAKAFLLLACMTGTTAAAQLSPRTIRYATLPTTSGWVTDSSRTAHLLGGDAEGFLIRSPSSLADSLTLGEWRIFAPVARMTWNGAIPVSENDGALWAGRGISTIATGGVGARFGRITVILAPELAYSENRFFRTEVEDRSERPLPGRSAYSSPWYVRAHSADLPLRFGDRPLLRVTPGQSTVMTEAGAVTVGASTENQWWGPGIRNAILMSDNAEGFPHLFARTRAPLRTRIGAFEAKWLLGWLTESLYFDADPTNDTRALNGLVATYRPAVEPGLTLGVSRVVYSAASRAGVAQHALDVLTHGSTTGEPTLGDDTTPSAAVASTPEQMLALFGRWVFPADGLELFGEWARTELPQSAGDFLRSPNHTQGFVFGMQWVRSLSGGDRLRVQTEVTYLEESSTYDERPRSPFYVSESAVQGYTHRGQPIGAVVGPGGSGQWLALDFARSQWEAGVFGGRTRWNNDVYYDKPGRAYVAHDVSVFGGVRGGVRVPYGRIGWEYRSEYRYNFLFQNPEREPFGQLATDVVNHRFSIDVTPLFR